MTRRIQTFSFFSELRGVQHPQQREHRGSPKRIHKHHLGRIRGEYRGVERIEYRVHGESHQRVRQPFRLVLRSQRTTDPEQHAEQRDVRSDRDSLPFRHGITICKKFEPLINS
jgi:hypothetical protein